MAMSAGEIYHLHNDIGSISGDGNGAVANATWYALNHTVLHGESRVLLVGQYQGLPHRHQGWGVRCMDNHVPFMPCNGE